MMSLIRGIAGFILAALLTAFAIFNRQNVEVSFSPVHEPLSLPLYLVVLGMFAGGFLIGGFIVWVNAGSTRKLTRKQRKQLKALEKELEHIKETDQGTTPPPADFFPALPKSLQKR